MFDFLEKLFCRKYRISFVVVRPLILSERPFHLFRGLFGLAVRKEVCTRPDIKNCSECSQNQDCPYTDIFEVKLPESHPLYRKYTYPPVPYIIYPDLAGKSRFLTGDTLVVELTLIGKAIEYDTFLLRCIQSLSEGKGTLYRKLECTGIETMVGDDRKSHLRFTTQPELANTLKIRFESPVIFKIQEKPAKSLPFEILIMRLSERLSLLSCLYCGAELPAIRPGPKKIHINNYIDSFYPVPVEIHDGGNRKTPSKPSLLGCVAYSGTIGEYMPLIRSGEVLHIGSYPNYGLGKYVVEDVRWL